MTESNLTKEELKEILKIDGQDPLKNAEPNFRLNIKETSKGFRYYEWTVRGDTLQELTDRDHEIRNYITKMRVEDGKNAARDISD